MFSKLKNFIILIIVLIVPKYSYSDNYPTGGASMSLANSTVAYIDVWSVHHNQAGLGFVEGINTGIFYQTNFLLTEISTKSLVLNYSFGKSSLGLEATSFGFSKYSDNKIGLAYGLQIFKNFALGFQIDYLNIHQLAEYGDKNLFTAEIGILAKPTENLNIGVHIFNPWRTKFSKTSDSYVNTVFKAGLSYMFNENVLFLAEVDKDFDLPTQFKTGFQYRVFEKLFLRVGASIYQNQWMPCFGLGYKLGNLSFDMSFENRPIVGLVSGLSIQYRFK